MLIGCSHIAHDANVRRGFQANILAVPSVFGKEGSGPSYIQWGSGYGIHLKNGNKILPQIYLIASTYDGNWHYFPSLDLYFQTKASKPYMDWGLIASLDPRFYFMWGNEWLNKKQPNSSFAMSYAAAVGLSGSLNMQMNLTWSRKNLSIGPLIEYRYYFSKAPCIECNNNDQENVGHIFMVGVLFNLHSNPLK